MKMLKLLVLSVILVIGGQMNFINAQLGKMKIKKPKINVPKTIKTPTKVKTETETKSEPKSEQDTKPTTSNSSKKSGNDKPKYDPEDPTYKTYSNARDALNMAKSFLSESKFEKTQEYLDKAQVKIDILKETPSEKDKEYLKGFIADHENYTKEKEVKLYAVTQDKIYDDKIEAYYKWAVLGWEIQDDNLKASYEGYYAFRKDFEENRPDKYKNSYVQKRVSAVDNFFKVEVYKRLPALEAKIDKIIKESHSLNSSGEEFYLLNAKGISKDFDRPIESINYKKNFLLEDKTEINRIEAKLMKEKNMLDEYVTSGKYDAHRAKWEKAIIDAVRLGKLAMSNSKYEAMAKKGVDKGSPLRTVITSSTWYIKKNEFGLPVY